MKCNSICYKLFFIIAIILLFNVVVSVFCGHSLMEKLTAKNLAREAKTNQMRKEFIANVSHHFKTPLTSRHRLLL